MPVDSVPGSSVSPEIPWWKRVLTGPEPETTPVPESPVPVEPAWIDSFFVETQENLSEMPLQGKIIVAVANPGAQGGKIGLEIETLASELEKTGAKKVVLLRTDPDPHLNVKLLSDGIRDVLQSHPGEVIYVLAYGGDKTVVAAMHAGIEAVGFDKLQTAPLEAASRLPQGFPIIFVFMDKGTAADLAVQVEGPKRMQEIGRYIAQSVVVPHSVPRVSFETGEGETKVILAGQSFTVGKISGPLFKLREDKKRENPNSILSRGWQSFILLMPKVIFNSLGLRDFEVELTKYDEKGIEIFTKRMKVTDLIFTPNPVLGVVGGIPDDWGRVRVLALHPNLAVAGWSLLKSGVLRLVTRLGLRRGVNVLTGEFSQLIVSEDRGFGLDPGQRMAVRVLEGKRKASRPVDTFGVWDGDSIKNVVGFEVWNQKFSVPVASAPAALGTQSSRAANGLAIRDSELLDKLFPEIEPKILTDSKRANWVRSAYFPQRLLRPFWWQQRLDPTRLPDLVLEVEKSGGNLNAGTEVLEIGALERFLEKEEGQRWRESRTAAQGLRERALRSGPPLLLGIASLFASHKIADAVGLDAQKDAEARFMLMVYFAHTVHAGLDPLWEVVANRFSGKPYDFTRKQEVRYLGEVYRRWHFHAYGSMPEAMAASWRSAMVLEEGGVLRNFFRRGVSWAALPFTAVQGMGNGLVFSHAAHGALSWRPDGAWDKEWVPTLSFFAPDVWNILHPRSAAFVLESGLVRALSRGAAALFLGELGYGVLQKVRLDENFSYDSAVRARVSASHFEGSERHGLSHALSLVAPQLASHWETHDYGIGPETSEARELRFRDQELASSLAKFLNKDLGHFSDLVGLKPQDLLSEAIVLDAQEQAFRERLQREGEAGVQLTLLKQAEIARQHFGVDANESWVKVVRAHCFSFQRGVNFLKQIEFHLPWLAYFDAEGKMHPDDYEKLRIVLAD